MQTHPDQAMKVLDSVIGGVRMEIEEGPTNSSSIHQPAEDELVCLGKINQFVMSQYGVNVRHST